MLFFSARLRAVLLGCAFALLGIAIGCTRSTQVASKPPQPASEEPYRWESEGEIPRLDGRDVEREVDRVETFEEIVVEDTGVAVETVAPPEPVEAVADTSDSVLTALGYRVQIFASGTRESAERVKADVEAALDTAVYVELIDGVYKVRVGDCVSRADAEQLRQRCRSSGYPDAWIVSSTVTIPRPQVADEKGAAAADP